MLFLFIFIFIIILNITLWRTLIPLASEKCLYFLFFFFLIFLNIILVIIKCLTWFFSLFFSYVRNLENGQIGVKCQWCCNLWNNGKDCCYYRFLFYFNFIWFYFFFLLFSKIGNANEKLCKIINELNCTFYSQ